MNLSRITRTGQWILCLAIGLSLNSIVAAEENTANPEDSAYITPDKLTREDKMMLSDYSNRYETCMNETSVAQLQSQDDPRHVVDFAMKQCAVELENLNMEMTARNIDPNFRQGYIRHITNHSVNRTLRMVMIGMANRQQGPVPPAE